MIYCWVTELECFARLLELIGPLCAASFGTACRATSVSPHAEVFWRMACEEPFEVSLSAGVLDEVPSLSLGSFSTWRAKFGAMHGPELARRGRRERLANALAARGLELRSDSIMCGRYVETGEVPGQGNMATIVDIMVEMSFFFQHTSYVSERNHLMEEVMSRAFADATDAFRAGEAASVNTQDYIEQPSNADMSELAKTRALWRYAQEFVVNCTEVYDSLPRLLASAPPTLHERLRDFHHQAMQAAAGQDVLPTVCPGALYDTDCNQEDATTRRSRLRAQAGRKQTHLEVELASSIDAIRQLAQEGGDGAIQFPPSLSVAERAFLHQLAEHLDLQHLSVGNGTSRALIVWNRGRGDMPQAAS